MKNVGLNTIWGLIMINTTDEGLDIYYDYGTGEFCIANSENCVFLSLNDLEKLNYLRDKKATSKD